MILKYWKNNHNQNTFQSWLCWQAKICFVLDKIQLESTSALAKSWVSWRMQVLTWLVKCWKGGWPQQMKQTCCCTIKQAQKCPTVSKSWSAPAQPRLVNQWMHQSVVFHFLQVMFHNPPPLYHILYKKGKDKCCAFCRNVCYCNIVLSVVSFFCEWYHFFWLPEQL